MKKRISIYLIIGLLAILGTGNAQKVTISGKIIADDTEEPQPFATVVIKGTTVGTSADLDGNYTLSIDLKVLAKSDTILISAIGFQTIKRRIYPTPEEQTYNFRLKPADFNLKEVLIKAGENPANIILRKIIKNKPQNARSYWPSYETAVYSKTELDIDNISPEMKKKKIFKPFSFIFENMDSVSDVKPFLPVYMAEETSTIYYTKEGGKEKEVISARKTSGIKNTSVVEFISSMHQKYDIYDNWFTILEKKFVSPFSDQGLSYYEYYIMDSTNIKGRWSYKLKFKPKRKQENTFYGDFWVDMKSFSVEIVNMRMNPEVNINWVNRIVLYSEFDRYKDSIWLPSKDKVIIDFFTTENTPGVIGRKTTTYRDFKIGRPAIANVYEAANPDAIDIDNLERPDSFWTKARHEKLSKNENSVYKMIDSIKKVPIYKTYLDIIRTVVTGYKEFGYFKIGPYFSMMSNNAVEGYRFKLGAGTTTLLSKKIYLYGYAAYGLRDQAWKYGGEVKLNLKKRPYSFIGMAYRNDVDLKSENSEVPSEDNIFSGIYRRDVPWKLLKTHEIKLFGQKSWRGGWSTRITALHRKMDPYESAGFNFYYQPVSDMPSQRDSSVETTEFIASLRYAYKEKFIESAFNQQSLGSRYPIIELQYTLGKHGALNTPFNYHKLILYINQWFDVPPFGYMKYKIEAGKIWGKLPFLLLGVHPGNETYFYTPGAFNGMNRFEFVSDQYAQIHFEHHLDGFIFNHLPLIRKLKWREVLVANAVYGTLSDENLQANAANLYNRSYLDFKAHPIPGEGVFFGSFDKNRPYVEVGFGIENILKFIRIDAVWRLNYLEARYADPFTIRGTMAFMF